MHVQFFKPVKIGSFTYGVGVHNVPPDDTNNNWFFDALVADGHAVILRGKEPEEKLEPEAEAAPEPQPEPEPEAEAEAEPPTKTKRNK